jgi:transcriptional regulator with XRE-family HTH domain
MTVDEIGNRIKILIEKENTTPQLFANEIGITLGGLNHILTGRNRPRYDFLLKIINKYVNINLDWLILGNLPMYKEEKLDPSKTTTSTLFDADNNDLLMQKKLYKIEDIKEKNKMNKSKKIHFEQSLIQPLSENESFSESIEKIIVYFKNKTYVTLKPEK